MSHLARLAALGLERPAYGSRELGAVLTACLDAIGAGYVVTARDAAHDRRSLDIPDASHVVVVVLDGLGHYQLEARGGHAPLMRSISAGHLTAGFPTTTATSMALFGTGFGAGRTGMTGYTARNPRTGTLANLISWEGAFDPEDWQTCPSLIEEAHRAGVTMTTLGNHGFEGSGLTQAALRGGRFIATRSLAARVDIAIEKARAPGLTYVYWGDIDAAGHKHGWQSDRWVAALEDADQELRRLATSLPRGAIMVVTADHGMVDVAGEPRWDVGTDGVLARDVELVAGEPRALHLYADPDNVAAVVARWTERLGDHAVVMTRDEAAAIGLFGPISADVSSRVGDVVVVMAQRATVVDSRTQSPHSLGLIGLHGSLTPEELTVPLLIAGRDS